MINNENHNAIYRKQIIFLTESPIRNTLDCTYYVNKQRKT